MHFYTDEIAKILGNALIWNSVFIFNALYEQIRQEKTNFNKNILC